VYCNNCGHRLAADEAICRSCGAVADPLAPDGLTTASPEVLRALPELTAHEWATLVGERRSQVGILVVARGPTPGSPFELTEPRTTLGRDPACDVFLDDITVSRHHAEIRRVGPAYVLSDSGSMNGTYLDGDRVEEALLGDGDELRIGKFRLVFFGPRLGDSPR